MVTTQFFGAKLQRYMHDHGIPEVALAQVAEKAFRNGSITPHAWRRTPMSTEEILDARMLAHPLTQYMLCSPGEGAAALVVCRARVSDRLPDARPVWLRSVAFRTRRPGSFEVFSPSLPLEIAPSPSVDAAREAFERAGAGPGDVDVAQVQDTESGAELIHLAECGLCEHGEQDGAVRDRRDRDRRQAPGQHRRRLPRQRRAGRRLGAAPGLRDRDAAPRRGGGAAGSGRAAARLHARLRRARRQRLRRAQPLTGLTVRPPGEIMN